MRAVTLLLLGTASGCVDLTIRPLEGAVVADAMVGSDAQQSEDGSFPQPAPDAGLGAPVNDCQAPLGMGWSFESGGLLADSTGAVAAVPAWVTVADGTPGTVAIEVTKAPEASTGCGGEAALRLTSAGFTEWGSGMRGFLLHQDQSETRTLNAGGAKWLRFTARSSAVATLTVRVEDLSTWPGGGVCTTCRGAFETSVMLGPSWRLYDIDLTRMALVGTVMPRPTQVDRGRLVALTFTIWRGAEREVWLDNVEFSR